MDDAVREYRIDSITGAWYHLIVGPRRQCALGSADGLFVIDRSAAADVLRRSRKRSSLGTHLFAVRRLTTEPSGD